MNATSVAPGLPTAANATKMDVAWHFHSILNGIQQGTGADDRIGNKIFVRYVVLALNFEMDGDSLVNGHVNRFGMLLDTTATSAVPADTTVFSTVPSSFTIWNSIKNYENAPRFRFLLDEQHRTVQTVGGAAAADNRFTSQAVIHRYIPVNKVFNYKSVANDTTGSNMVGDQLLLMNCASVTGCCTTICGWRVIFNDA